MTDELALLRAICDAPYDDAPRLVYADWLDEHGDSLRAEFVRVQCELARPDVPRVRRLRLVEREGELRSRARLGEWAAGLPDELRSNVWEFRRGMLAELQCSASALLRHATALRERFPIESLQVSPCDLATRDLNGLFACPVLEGVSALVISGLPGADDGIFALAASPSLRRLEAIAISCGRISPLAAGALCESSALRRVRRFRMSARPLSREVRQLFRERFGDGAEV